MRKEDFLRSGFKKYICSKKFIELGIKEKNIENFDCATFVKFLFETYFKVNISQNGFGKSLTSKIFTSSIGETIITKESLNASEKLKIIKEQVKIGDIMFFHRQSLNDNNVTENNYYPGHVGIYIGDGKFVDARPKRGNITVCDLSKDECLSTFCGYKDIIKTIILNKELKNETSL